jgi:hypothetical protein
MVIHDLKHPTESMRSSLRAHKRKLQTYIRRLDPDSFNQKSNVTITEL